MRRSEDAQKQRSAEARRQEIADVQRLVYRTISGMLGLRRGSRFWPRPTLLDVISDQVDDDDDYEVAKKVVQSVDDEMKRRLSTLMKVR